MQCKFYSDSDDMNSYFVAAVIFEVAQESLINLSCQSFKVKLGKQAIIGDTYWQHSFPIVVD